MIFLSSSCCSEGAKLISADGHNIPELLTAILELLPLDTYVFNPVTLMDLVNSDKQKSLEVIRASLKFKSLSNWQIFMIKSFNSNDLQVDIKDFPLNGPEMTYSQTPQA